MESRTVITQHKAKRVVSAIIDNQKDIVIDLKKYTFHRIMLQRKITEKNNWTKTSIQSTATMEKLKARVYNVMQREHMNSPATSFDDKYHIRDYPSVLSLIGHGASMVPIWQRHVVSSKA